MFLLLYCLKKQGQKKPKLIKTPLPEYSSKVKGLRCNLGFSHWLRQGNQY
jgi:hypothetical protein